VCSRAVEFGEAKEDVVGARELENVVAGARKEIEVDYGEVDKAAEHGGECDSLL